ncbi:hypothetical protein UFOVP820_45 [uncultured Caudovirales phage]|uniref:Uncharacterized protein n=1 Tax=uncultured Caudovirales phage TaxID=2100421 RepID=A0A6J5P2A6_9CAUD|nr:hypothetical protein UFOVP820_45 [uncultured Caudovirales phage]
MPTIEFISGAATACIAIATFAASSWRMLMKHVKEIARTEATLIVEKSINQQLANVASKSAVEDLQRATQRITERIDELFTVLLAERSRRTDSR